MWPGLLRIRVLPAALLVFSVGLLLALLNATLPFSQHAPLVVWRCPGITVLVIAYNRSRGLESTLGHLQDVRWHGCEVPLTVCIDGGGSHEVVSVANDFVWEHGAKWIKRRDRRVGLAANVMNCWEDPQPNSWGLIVEDDVSIGAAAFEQFVYALELVEARGSDQLAGIALNRLAVNQYCVEPHVNYSQAGVCSVCGHRKWSPLGSLFCPPVAAQILLIQIPSSWGAFYKAALWTDFRQYFSLREAATVGQTIRMQISDSMSNEWEDSWKRYLLELLVSTGRVLGYLQFPRGALASTERARGVHTGKYDEVGKCFFSSPVLQTELRHADVAISRVFDYCGRLLSPRNDSSSLNLPTPFPDEFLERKASRDTHFRFWATPQVVLVTSIAAYSPIADEALRSWLSSNLSMVIVFAPAKVCPRLRNQSRISCVPESRCMQQGQPSPLLSCMIRAAYEAFPAAELFAVVNGDVALRNFEPFVSLYVTIRSRLGRYHAFVGHRRDCVFNAAGFDHDCSPEYHSSWGIDYFFLSPIVVPIACASIRGFAVGRVRWDNQLLGSLLAEPRILVYDTTQIIDARHLSSSWGDVRISHNHRDHQNIQLATAKYRRGRLTHVPLLLFPNGSIVLRSTLEIEANDRLQFDLWVERKSKFVLTSSGIVGFDICVCQAMRKLERSLDFEVHPGLRVCARQLTPRKLVIVLGGVVERLVGVDRIPNTLWKLNVSWDVFQTIAKPTSGLCCVSGQLDGSASLQRPVISSESMPITSAIACY